MIIECVNCSKKFSVNSELIPSEGRTIQCGSCNHIWFYKKDDQIHGSIKKSENIKITSEIDKKDVIEKILPKVNKKKQIKIKEKSLVHKEAKGSEIVEYTYRSNFSFGKLLSYIIVIIISFIAIILTLDTFKVPLYNFFPNLEFILYSLYETLKDIGLFIKDLI